MQNEKPKVYDLSMRVLTYLKSVVYNLSLYSKKWVAQNNRYDLKYSYIIVI